MKIKKIVLLLLLTLGLHSKNYAQENVAYINTVKTYTRYVDSIIMEASVNPSSGPAIVKTSNRISNIQKDSSWCGEAVLYKDDKNDSLYRLSYSGHCDSTYKLQDYYFNNNKIVFVRTVRSTNPGENTDQYYFNDTIMNTAIGKLYLTDGYEILKKLSN